MSYFVPYVTSINEHITHMTGKTQDNSTKTKTTHWEQPWGYFMMRQSESKLAVASLYEHWYPPMENSQWSFFSPYFPESAIKNNSLLVKEAATEGKEKKWKSMVAPLDDESNNSHTSIYPPARSRWGDILCYPAEFPWIVWDSCQSARCKCPSCAWKIRSFVHGPEGARAATGTGTPSSSKHTEEQSVTTFTVQCFSAFYMQHLIMISIRILTSSSIKILQLLPLSKELPKSILESRWALLSVPMKMLFTMLYISRCDIISGTSHSPHLQWTTVLICVLGGEDLALESHDVTLMLYYLTIHCT